MQFTLTIKMDNAAFFEDANGSEVACVLRRLADRVNGCNMTEGDRFALFDSNGNRVGEAVVRNEEGK